MKDLAKDLSDVLRDSLLPVKRGNDCLSQLYASVKAISEVLNRHGEISEGEVREFINHSILSD